MRIIYTLEARIEIVEAGTYYRRISKGLAKEFKQRLIAAVEDIRRHPEAWRKLDDKYRRKLLKQFPYGVVYHPCEPGCIEIVAVMHLHREPDYWRGRGE